MSKIITNYDETPDNVKALNSIFSPAKVVFAGESLPQILDSTFDIAILKNQNVNPILYGADSKIQWIHCNVAGLDSVDLKSILAKNIKITGAAGRSADALAEHVFYFLLNHIYKCKQLIYNQQNHIWDQNPLKTSGSLEGCTLGIIGFGNTGKAILEKANAFKMNVIAYSYRNISDEYELAKKYSFENGDSILPLVEQSDFIALTTSLNDKTFHIINKEIFSHMKKSAMLINISRGAIIKEEDLIEALRDGKIAGAGLDVFEEEPLSKNSPLWDLPNVYVTPHATPHLPNFNANCFEIIKENYARYLKKEPLLNQMQKRDILSH